MEFIDGLPGWRLSPEHALYLKGALLGMVPDLLQAAGVLLAGFVIYKLTAQPLRRILVRNRVEPWLARIVAFNIYKFVVVAVAVAAALGQVGIHVGAALTGIGIAGIAVGFIAQDSLANIVAGFLISIDKPFRVGDYLTVNPYYGRVEQITVRSTRIRTQDNTYVVIPNSKIINEVVVDHTTNGETRVNVQVSIVYEASVEQARTAILEAVASIDGVLDEPAPDVVVDKLGESGVELLVRVWIVDASSERRVYFRTNEIVKEALESAGIPIAYPHMEIVGQA